MATQRKGFTLVELSIVLIIIGLIIGGVLKGTDLINSAKQKKFYNTFLKGWQVAANSYQDRTGRILGDGAPNGGTAVPPAAAANDGLREDVALSTTGTIQLQLRRVGIDVPITNTGGSAGVVPDGGSYSIEGKYATSTVAATLAQQPVNGRARNTFFMATVPTDVAIALDTMIDGVEGAAVGDCRISANANTNLVDNPATTWGNSQTVLTVGVSILF